MPEGENSISLFPFAARIRRRSPRLAIRFSARVFSPFFCDAPGRLPCIVTTDEIMKIHTRLIGRSVVTPGIIGPLHQWLFTAASEIQFLSSAISRPYPTLGVISTINYDDQRGVTPSLASSTPS